MTEATIKKFVVTSGFLCLSQGAWAISNIENERPNLPEQGLSGLVNIGFAGKTGDEQKQAYDAAAKIVYRTNDEIFMGMASAGYGETQRVKDTDNSFLHGRWTHLLDEQWATELFGQWEKNEFSNLTARILAGGGGRYTVAQEKDVYSFVIGFGAFRESEKLDLDSYDETTYRWRLNSYYSYTHQINEQLTFMNTTYFQPDVDDFNDQRALSDIGLGIKMSTNLQLKINYRVIYDSDPAKNLDVSPAINNHKTNTEYKTSLVYRF